MTKALSSNKKAPYGEITHRRSKRIYSPSSAGFESEEIRRAIEASFRNAGNDVAAATRSTRSAKGKNLDVFKTATRITKGRKLQVGKMKRTQVVTPDGKRQSSYAKLRSRFGYNTGVQSEDDSESSQAANTKVTRMPSAKSRANDDAEISGEASRKTRIKMIAGYNSLNGVNDTGDETTVKSTSRPRL